MSVDASCRHPTTSVLFFYTLGKLHEAHATAIDRHLRSCQACGQLAAAVQNDVADLALALEPVPVSTLARDSLLHNAREVHRLSDTLPTLRRALGCSLAEAQAVLGKVDTPRYWQRLGAAWILPLGQAAPRGAELVRLSLDARFRLPRRRAGQLHVLQGHARTTLGPLRAGRVVKVPGGSRFAAYPGPDVLLLFTWVEEFRAVAPQKRASAGDVRQGTGAATSRRAGVARLTEPTGSG